MDILKVSLLKCTTASETLLMHRTTFLCLSLVHVEATCMKCLHVGGTTVGVYRLLRGQSPTFTRVQDMRNVPRLGQNAGYGR